MEPLRHKKAVVVLNPIDLTPEFILFDGRILPFTEGLIGSLEYAGYDIISPPEYNTELINANEV
jgi:hypothetical protein